MLRQALRAAARTGRSSGNARCSASNAVLLPCSIPGAEAAVGYGQSWRQQVRLLGALPQAEPVVVVDNELPHVPVTRGPFPSKSTSLAIPPSSPLYAKEAHPGGLRELGLKLLAYYSKESRVNRASEALYRRVVAQVEDSRLYESLNLPKVFRTVHSMLVLHVWMLLVRLRAEGKEAGAPLGQTFYDVFQHDVEQRVVKEGVKTLISRWTKELEKNFYGAATAYDAALKPEAGKDDLVQALWRNVFAEDKEDMPAGEAAAPVHALAQYVRRELESLAVTDSEAVLSGNLQFSQDFGSSSV